MMLSVKKVSFPAKTAVCDGDVKSTVLVPRYLITI